MGNASVSLFIMSVSATVISLFAIILLPIITKKNWHERSEKIEKVIIRSSKIVGFFGLLVGIYCFIAALILKK